MNEDVYWRPIETADKGYGYMLLLDSNGIFEGSWCSIDDWWYTQGPDGSRQMIAPTHWSPQPTHPNDVKKGAREDESI